MYARVETETLEEMTDAELIRRFKRGDDEALATLLTRHNDALYRFCCHLVSNRQDAEDICQESLTRAIDRVDTLKAGSAFRSWLFRIARNLSIDAFRQQRRVCPLPEEDVTPEELHADGPQEVVEVGEERHIVSVAMRRLTKNHQKVLLLREVEGLTYAEIARRLDLSQSAVETLLFRARRRLREEYGKTSLSLPGLALVTGPPALASRLAGPLSGGASLLGKFALTAAVIGGTAASVPHLFPRTPHFSTLSSTHHLAVFQPVAAPHVPRTVKVIAARSPVGTPRVVVVRERVTPPPLARSRGHPQAGIRLEGNRSRQPVVVGLRSGHVAHRMFDHSLVVHAPVESLIAVGQRLRVTSSAARHPARAPRSGQAATGPSGDTAVANPTPATLQIAAGPPGEIVTARGGQPPSNQGAAFADPSAASSASDFSSGGAAGEGTLPAGSAGPTGVSVPAAPSVGFTQPAAPATSPAPQVANPTTSLATPSSGGSVSPSSRPGSVSNTGSAGGPGASAPSATPSVRQGVGSSTGETGASLDASSRQ